MKPAKKKKLQKKIENKVFSIFLKEPKKTLNYKQVSSKIKETDSHIKLMVAEALVSLKKKKKLEEVEPGRFKVISQNAGVYEGTIDISRRGSVFFCSDSLKEDLPVKKKPALHVLKGDVVLVEVHQHKGKELAKVIELVHREEKSHVGIIDISENFAFLKADDPFMPVDIFIPKNRLMGAKTGQKVLANITDWPESADSPFGEIVHVIGDPGETSVEMESILYEFGLPFDFPRPVLEAAEMIPVEITGKEVSKRKDFRKVTTFTIDPHDAKDFDDALSFEKLDKDKFRIGVHIADVSHYVREGSVLDKEASKRATSVYLANQVVPMLPEVLSNVLCSLRPKEDKLCFSAVFDMNSEGEVLDYWIGRTVIHSDRRFTYEEAQKVIESGKGDMVKELTTLNGIARVLRARRMEVGGFNFHSSEISFQYDENGEPVGVKQKVIQEANELIEEFMLMANKHVAIWVGKIAPKPPFIYRNHDAPDPEKLANLKRFANSFDLSIDIRSGDIRNELKTLMERAKGTAAEGVIGQMTIRSMSKADYGIENIGHYGLAFDNYSHFTSPIRRYPDVVAHRLLAKYLAGDKKVDPGQVDFYAKHSSIQERKAVEAERASKKFMQALYMSKFIGKSFAGTVSGVTKFGLFVTITETHCEGMVSIRTMDDDNYSFDDTAYAIIGLKSRQAYRLGDDVNVRVEKADALSRMIDLSLV